MILTSVFNSKPSKLGFYFCLIFQPPSSNKHPITYFLLVPLIHLTLFINNFFWESELKRLNSND
jgi:hypothetical protein